MKEQINSFVLGDSIVLGCYLIHCSIDNYAHSKVLANGGLTATVQRDGKRYTTF